MNWIDPKNVDPSREIKNKEGGLEMYVNAKLVGRSKVPLARPKAMQPNDTAEWKRGKPLRPSGVGWPPGLEKTSPLALVGCQRTSDEITFRNFAVPGAVFDELAIWTTRLVRFRDVVKDF